MPSLTSRLLVADYIKCRLRKDDLHSHWPNCPRLAEPGQVQFCMRAIGSELENRYSEVFVAMANSLNITPNTAQITYFAVVQELFNDGVNWGRIVALFAFSGCLAVHCVKKEMSSVVDQILEWTSEFLENRLHGWITQHGGWVSKATWVPIICNSIVYTTHQILFIQFLMEF